MTTYRRARFFNAGWPARIGALALGCLLLAPSGVLAQAGGAGSQAARTQTTLSQAAADVPAAFRGRPLKIATREISPFVMAGTDGKLRGFSIDLWDTISKRLNITCQYAVVPDVTALINDVQSGKADAGISAVTITAAREVLIDFSQPMFSGGLQIAVHPQKESVVRADWEIVSGVLFSSSMLKLAGVMFLCAVVVAHLAWLVERRHDECGVVEHKKYFPGIFKAFWWSMGTIGSQVDEMPRTWAGRALAVFWMFCAIVFVAYFTANVTTNLTLQNLKMPINGPGDLPGKTVATTSGSTAQKYLADHGAHVVPVEDMAQAWKMLADGNVEAVVADAPVIQYYAANARFARPAIVGDVFLKENYGIVFPNDSPLRGPVNTVLLEMQEDGSYQALADKWFKTPSGGN